MKHLVLQNHIQILERNGEQTVSARELHAFLGSKRDFSNWIKDRIEKYGLVEKQDFEVFNNFVENPSGGRPLIEYSLSIDAAKELAMVEGNDKGKQARQYFIEAEKALKYILNSKLMQAEQSAKMRLLNSNRIHEIDITITHLLNERKACVKNITEIDRNDFMQLNIPFNSDYSRYLPESKRNKSLNRKN
ncbi:MAG: antA/AntB antirepressor family protein [Oscillospiraceae bacterium]|jgi:phage anti-repressor protein|nr:antA/AntB antirepressor family protein [Oscillospiraceae bacterium]